MFKVFHLRKVQRQPYAVLVETVCGAEANGWDVARPEEMVDWQDFTNPELEFVKFRFCRECCDK